MCLSELTSRIVLRVFAVLLSTLLIACGDNLPTRNSSLSSDALPSIDNSHDAQVWLEQQKRQSQNAVAGNVNTPAQNDRGLLRNIGSVSDKTFVSMNASAVDSLKNKSTDGAAMVQSAQANSGLLDASVDMAGIRAESKARVELELPQASLSQIKFLGVMQAPDELFGLVQVGERVYRVKQNESIGAGKWRVASIDEARMQLKVKGKVVTYDK
ncbi:MAG: hypothetical protein H6R05_1655 [Burkholderiaceae bacterium]|nr:hypothetical protein [Burkholderiaceae bacterium]